MRLRAFGVLLVTAVAGPALADEPPQTWSGDVSAGLVTTSGNSQTATSNAKGELVYNSERWRNTLNGAALQTQQTSQLTGQQEVTAERYTAGNKTDLNFTERDYAFLALEYEKDLKGATRERTSETVGYGRKVLTGPDHILELEIGGGVRQTETQATPTAPVADRDDDAIGRGRLLYKWNFSENSNFSETAKVESGDTNTFSESVTEAKLSLLGKLYALASYTVRNNSKVPAGTEKTDTITSISLGWTFGK
jgi:putative salt-induced outer membrane protein